MVKLAVGLGLTVKHEVSELGGIGDTKAAQSSGECKQVPS